MTKDNSEKDAKTINTKVFSIEKKLDMLLDVLAKNKVAPDKEVNDIVKNLSAVKESINDSNDEFELGDLDIPNPVLYKDGDNNYVEAQEDNDNEDNDNWVSAITLSHGVKPKLSFDIKLRIADDETKKMYSEIKNELLSYGLHARISRYRENFNKKRHQIARFVINGKTLKCYLGIDPKTLDEKYYHHKDVSMKKGTTDLPTCINVKSKIAVRKIKELIAIITEQFVILKKKRYTEHDFASDLTTKGFSKLELKGYDYMRKDSFSRQEANDLPEFFAEPYINNVKIEPDDSIQEKFIVSLKTLSDNFESYTKIGLDELKKLGLAPANSNYLSIKASDLLEKALIIYCNDITPTAAKMVVFSGGIIFRYTSNDTSTLAFNDIEEEEDDEDNDEDFD